MELIKLANKKMKIIIASENPVKINATQLGFESYFSGIKVEGAKVSSEVSDQPMSDIETLTGARNRAEKAKLLYPESDFWIGIEGGLECRGRDYFAFAWIVILNDDKRGESRTTSFQLPLKVAQLIHEGFELGVANDKLFNKNNSKQKSGAVGILTKDKVSRTELYKQAVQLALIPFVQNALY